MNLLHNIKTLLLLRPLPDAVNVSHRRWLPEVVEAGPSRGVVSCTRIFAPSLHILGLSAADLVHALPVAIIFCWKISFIYMDPQSRHSYLLSIERGDGDGCARHAQEYPLATCDYKVRGMEIWRWP